MRVRARVAPCTVPPMGWRASAASGAGARAEARAILSRAATAVETGQVAAAATAWVAVVARARGAADVRAAAGVVLEVVAASAATAPALHLVGRAVTPGGAMAMEVAEAAARAAA